MTDHEQAEIQRALDAPEGTQKAHDQRMVSMQRTIEELSDYITGDKGARRGALFVLSVFGGVSAAAGGIFAWLVTTFWQQ